MCYGKNVYFYVLLNHFFLGYFQMCYRSDVLKLYYQEIIMMLLFGVYVACNYAIPLCVQ